MGDYAVKDSHWGPVGYEAIVYIKRVFLVKYHNANHLFPMGMVFSGVIFQAKLLWLH